MSLSERDFASLIPFFKTRFARLSLNGLMSAKLYVENSMGQVVGVPESILALVRHDLAIAPRAATVPRPGDVTALEYLVSQEGVFPAGLTTEIERLLKKWGVPTQLNDMRVRPMEDLPLHSGIKLRPYQEKLVERALDLGRGVIDSPPRSGKTRMGAAVIDRNPLPAVWVAPTRGIVQQTVKALKGMLSAGHGDAGVLECMGGWPKSAKGVRAAMAARVVVTTAASAVRFPESFYRTRQVLFVDEVHHGAAESYAIINRLAAPVFHRYGMTGTHFRSDPNTEIKMHAVISEVIGRVSVRELIQLKYLVPADVVFIPISEPNLPPGLDASEAYRRGIVQNRARNAWAAWAAQVLASGGRRVIVLVKHIQHGEILQGLIPGAVFVKGEDGAELDDEGIDMVSRAIGDFNAGKIQILIGTSVLGEGIDLPAADALVYAKGGSASVTVTQDFFRVLTGAEGKYPAVIVDFADRTDDYLLGQAAKRGAIYTREECFNVTVANDVDPEKDLRGVLAPIALLR